MVGTLHALMSIYTIIGDLVTTWAILKYTYQDKVWMRNPMSNYLRNGDIANQIGSVRFWTAEKLRGVESEALQLIQTGDLYRLLNSNRRGQSTKVKSGRATKTDVSGHAITISFVLIRDLSNRGHGALPLNLQCRV